MTFAAWEKEIRLYNEFVTIFTKCAENGEVILAWSGFNVWQKQ